jgi:hypothetical protein
MDTPLVGRPLRTTLFLICVGMHGDAVALVVVHDLDDYEFGDP